MATSQGHIYFPINFQQARLLLIADVTTDPIEIKAAGRQCLPEVELVITADLQQADTYLKEWLDTSRTLPKLILLELTEDRKQWLEELKSSTSPYHNLPLIVLGGSTDKAEIREAYELGCSAYLVKSAEGSHWFQTFGSLRRYWWETVLLPG
ncbi:hypothetical protein [Telluribacter sp.]|jgi:DNA-binding NarL/FixJ family response regulator|uniref:hypothetical protein n=1 Tax=Telluribacter sp. TaxID=1978767 RepID=UPI002E0D753A|nr:hypothetical protein [Telluribacter sp.]